MSSEFIINLPELYSFNSLNSFMEKGITIKQVSYENTEQARILKACLETWFQNPKDLQLTNPSIRYPFNYNKWMEIYSSKLESITYVIKKNEWIIGHLSIQLRPLLNSIHIFHVFIDRENRGKKYSKLLIDKILKYAKTNQIEKITLGVVKKNPIAIGLYEKYGFKIFAENKLGSYKMELYLGKPKNQ